MPNPTGLGIFQDIKFCSDCLTDVAEMSKLLYLRFSINNFYTGSSFCRLPTASTAYWVSTKRRPQHEGTPLPLNVALLTMILKRI